MIANKKVVIKETLPCKLTDDERLARADDLANAVQVVEQVRQEKKSLVRQVDARLNAAESKREELADVVASGREYREVIVHQVFDYDKGVVTETRIDTGEVIASRDLTDEERQASLLEEDDES